MTSADPDATPSKPVRLLLLGGSGPRRERLRDAIAADERLVIMDAIGSREDRERGVGVPDVVVVELPVARDEATRVLDVVARLGPRATVVALSDRREGHPSIKRTIWLPRDVDPQRVHRELVALATARGAARTGHLVLTRRRGESVMIGDEIEITLLQVRGGTVRLGISAPRGTPILRRELHGT